MIREEIDSMIKEKNVHEDLIYISSQFSKLLKKSFGKGPDSCFSTLKDDMLFVHIRQFLTPAEEVLLAKGRKTFAIKFRYVLLEFIFEEFKQELCMTLGIEFDSYYHDWNYEANSGLVLFVKKENGGNPKKSLQPITNVSLKESIVSNYAKIYTTPSDVNVWEVNHNIVLAECNDVLLPIEKELYKQGHYDLLINHLDEIKSKLLNQMNDAFSPLNKRIIDLFVVWDYSTGKNYVVFYTK